MRELTLLCSFDVKGKAVPQARPRSAIIDGKVVVHDEQKSSSYKNIVRMAALYAMRSQGYKGPVEHSKDTSFIVRIEVNVGVPESLSKRRKAMCLSGALKPVGKPDVDNIAKAILDAMNGAVYKDDAGVTELSICKRYGSDENAHIDVLMENLV